MTAAHNSKPNYAFVDADNIALGLARKLDSTTVAKSDYRCFSISEMLRRCGHDRVLVYSGAETDDTVAPWIEDIQSLDGFVVRTGRVKRKGKLVKQQGVDVKLAIDAIQHATRGNMKSCEIYSGDGDFIPLIDALVEAGVFVSVSSFGNPEKGDVAPTLRSKADAYNHLHGHELFNRCTADWFKGGADLRPTGLQSVSQSYGDSAEEIKLGDTTHIVTTLDGIRFFFKRKAEGRQQGYCVRFSSKRQAEIWLRFVWPDLKAVPLWKDLAIAND